MTRSFATDQNRGAYRHVRVRYRHECSRTRPLRQSRVGDGSRRRGSRKIALVSGTSPITAMTMMMPEQVGQWISGMRKSRPGRDINQHPVRGLAGDGGPLFHPDLRYVKVNLAWFGAPLLRTKPGSTGREASNADDDRTRFPVAEPFTVNTNLPHGRPAAPSGATVERGNYVILWETAVNPSIPGTSKLNLYDVKGPLRGDGNAHRLRVPGQLPIPVLTAPARPASRPR